MSARLCIALDLADGDSIQRVASQTEEYAAVFKVGLTAIYGAGTGIVTTLRQRRPVFVDAKLHDIPAQVEKAASAIGELGASYVTVHAAGGHEMVRAAVSGAGPGLQVLAVTVLTSLDDDELGRLGMTIPVESAVLRFADRALHAGAHGLVCSGHEVTSLRRRFGNQVEGGPLLVVPGIRPAGGDPSDQRRTLAPRAALEAGADLLVVGRPITGAPDPSAAARRFSEELMR